MCRMTATSTAMTSQVRENDTVLEPFNRRGAHILRHLLAVHLLRSGETLKSIGDLPGHRRPDTTFIYTIDMAMKRKSIERFAPSAPGPEGESRWHASKDIIQWLEDL
jgi:site-specific recombinase XerD